MVVAEAPPWIALAVVSIAVAIASSVLLATRRGVDTPLLSVVAFGVVVAAVVFLLGMIGISWLGAILNPGWM